MRTAAAAWRVAATSDPPGGIRVRRAGQKRLQLVPEGLRPAFVPGRLVSKYLLVSGEAVAIAARDRVLAAAMRLFAEHGFAATTITQIEQAAGLSQGAGGIYRHFPSKVAILEAGVASQIASGADFVSMISDASALARLPLRERLLVVAKAGMRRLEQEGDLNRLVLRDLSRFPHLVDQVGRDDIGRVFRAFAGWLADQPDVSPDTDLEAIAIVLMGAVTHFWIMREIFGDHPAGVNEDRYLTATADLAATLLTGNKGATTDA